MSRLTSKQRSQVQAVVSAFNFSGFSVKINTSLNNHFRSFVGRDFKALAQCALFIFRDYFTPEEKRAWLALSKVPGYYNIIIPGCNTSFLFNYLIMVRILKWVIVNTFYWMIKNNALQSAKNLFVKLGNVFLILRKRLKYTYIFLHLVDNMIEFGPTSAFNMER